MSRRLYQLDFAATGLSWVPPVGLVYHPLIWRGFTDFGSGALCDIAPHHVKMLFQALDVSTLAFPSQTAVGEPVPIQAMPAWLGSPPSRLPAA